MIASSARRPSGSDISLPASDGTASLLSLDGNDIHLWLCLQQGATSSDTFKRNVLSNYAAVAPQEWRFTVNGNGKPEIHDAPVPLQFNLSDSGDWLVCAVTIGAAVGVDLEYCDSNREVLKLARRCYSSAELAALQACSESEQYQRFYDYWTLKEASIKSRGGSLGRELETTAFELEFPVVRSGAMGAVVRAVPANDDYCCLLDPVPGYRLAVCKPGGAKLQPCLRLFNVDHDHTVEELPILLRACSSTAG